MNNSRRITARFAAQYVEDSLDSGGPSETGYTELMALVADMRSEEYKALKSLSRVKDGDERTQGYYHVAMEAFPLLQIADDELKRGLKRGEWEPEIVIKALRGAANASGAMPKRTSRRNVKKGLRSG